MGEFSHNDIIPLRKMRKTAVAAILDGLSVLAGNDGVVTATIGHRIERTEAEETVQFLHPVTGVVFAILVLKITGAHRRPPLKMQKAATRGRTAAVDTRLCLVNRSNGNLPMGFFTYAVGLYPVAVLQCRVNNPTFVGGHRL